MDSQSPVAQTNVNELDLLRFAAYLMPVDQYATRTLNFPSTNCHPPYGNRGLFALSMTIYQEGAKVLSVDLPQTDERGCIEFDFDEVRDLLSPTANSILLAAYRHTEDVPVEIYYSNLHRQSGTYIAYPALAYMGDKIYPAVHSTQLENTLFWPGLPNSEKTSSCLVALNPYKLPFDYQISLYTNGQLRAQSEALALAPFCAIQHEIEELFPKNLEEIRNSGGRCAICIAAQYKVISFMMFKDRASGVATGLDHLHNYCLV